MANNEVEFAKKVLEDDLRNNPYVLSAPLGHGVTSQKIYTYLYTCVLSNVSKDNCVDWLYDLYHEQSDDEKHMFKSIIDSVACALYGFIEHINKNKAK